ncbi:MAG: phospholipase, partial [Bacteroidetes bacterium]|nr:phospholipase [Bacteroidota bacterium]
GEKVFRKLQDFIDDIRIEDLEIPYAAVSVDIKNHSEVIFRSGSLVKAIRASVSIPTLIRPITYQGIELVDGGVLNPLPLDTIVKTGNDIVVAVDLNSNIPYTRKSISRIEKGHDSKYRKAKEFINRKWPGSVKEKDNRGIGFFDLITESIYTMQMKLTELSIEKNKPDILVRISRHSCEIYEYHRASEMIDYGRKQLRSALAEFEGK